MTNAPLTQSTRTLLGNLQLVNSRNSETLNSVNSRNKFSSFGAFVLPEYQSSQIRAKPRYSSEMCSHLHDILI